MAIDWIAFGGFTVKSMFYKNIDYRNPTFLGGVPGSNRVIGVAPTSPPGVVVSGPAYGLAGSLDPAWNRLNWWLQMRGDIYVIARASADLQGVFGIEVNSRRFGDADNKYINYSGSSGLGQSLAGRWNADAIAIQVKSMYIDFKVPEIPLRLKVGIQPFRLRESVFLYADAAGITGNLKIPAGDYIFNINPFWAVMYKGTQTTVTATFPTDWTTADEGNFFGVDFNAVLGGVKPGIFFAMQREGQKYTAEPNEGNRNLWWLGGYVDAKFGGLAITADFIYNGGYDQWKNGTINVTDPGSPIPFVIVTPRTYSVRHEAWLARGEVSYTMNKVTLGLGGLYGTGDNLGTLDKQEGFFQPYRSEGTKFNEDFLVLCGDWGLRQPYGTDNTGGLFKPWSNFGQGVWYVRGFADFAVTDWLKLKVNGGYIGDTVRHGDEFGTDFDDDATIGWEMDFGAQINIYKNLYLDTAFGYLIGGKALAGQYLGDRAQDPWLLATVLTYVF
jgi:hypothetical protein